MNIVTLDFETYYSSDYSLSRMTTEEYIRDPRFEVIMCSVKHGDGHTLFSTGETVAETFANIDWDNSLVVAHNMKFDGAILGWKYGIHPKMYACTLAMAQGLGLHHIAGGLSLAKLTTWAQSRGVNIKDKGDEVVHALGKRLKDFSLSDMHKYGAYCNTDTDNAYALFKYYIQSLAFPAIELPVISECMRVYCDPLLVLDKPLLESRLISVVDAKEASLDRAGVTLEQVRSDAVFAALLQDMGVDPPTKLSPKQKNPDGTPKVVWAFSKADEAFTALEEDEDELIANLVSARLGNKTTIEESRTRRFLTIESRGTLPFPLRYCAAHTGRFGGDEKLNLQNLSRLKPLLRAGQVIVIAGKAVYASQEDVDSREHMQLGLRHTFKAPPGHTLVVGDSAQIEARVVAWLAEQDDLVAAFAAKVDIYSAYASEVFQRHITKQDKAERFVGKTSILGLGFGMGWAKAQATLRRGQGDVKYIMSDEQSKQNVAFYRTKNYRIKGLWDEGRNAISAMLTGGACRFGRTGVLNIVHANEVEPFPRIVLPNGMAIRYPGLQSHRYTNEQGKQSTKYTYDTRKGKAVVPTHIYGGKIVENVVQGLARIVVTDQWMQIKKRAVKERLFHRSPVVGQVHDELVCCVTEDRAADLEALMIEEMSKAPAWAAGLPVACEVGIAKRYGDAK